MGQASFGVVSIRQNEFEKKLACPSPAFSFFFYSKKESSKLNTSVGKICANTVETSCLVRFLCEGNIPGQFKNYFTVNSQVHSY